MKAEETIFAEALGISSVEGRAAYLNQACGGDTALRQQVEALLNADQHAGGFMQSPAPALGVTDAADSSGSSPTGVTEVEPIGSTVGPYKLLERIGEGGMGVVYMADQLHPVRRRVALKIIKPGMDSRQVIARFEAERQALAMMDHPSIARVLDAGTTEAGRLYFAMELVKGVPITEYCDKNNLTPRERLKLFVQVCQAVQHAHTKGVIHRDLKPSNILVTLHDGVPVPKVIDFGIAKATGGAAQQLTDKTLFTHFAQMIGTPLYMSPEQAEFSGLDVDTRSDVYSLGVLLYELLTGTTPFDKKRLGEAALDEVRRIIREEEPPRPSTRLSTLLGETLTAVSAHRKTDPGKLGQSMRGELDWIVMKSLEKDRTQRYETANGLARDVERFLADEQVQACPPSALYRFRKFARRNKGLLAATALVAMTLLLGTLVSTWQAVRATRALQSESAARRDADTARRIAKAEALKATTEAAIAQAVNDFLNRDLLAQADSYIPYDRYEQPIEELKLTTVLDRAAQQLEGRFADQPLVEASLRQTIGKTYHHLRQVSRGIPHLQRAIDLRRTHLGEEHTVTLATMVDLGYATSDAALVKQVLDVRRRVLGQDHPDTLSSMLGVALVARERGETASAITLLRETLQAQRIALGESHGQTAWTMHCLAHTLVMNAGKAGIAEADAREIESMYRHALAIFRKEHGETWHTYDVTEKLGEFLSLRGRYEEAAAVFKDALARLQTLPAAPSEMVGRLTQRLIHVYQRWGKPAEAETWAQEAAIQQRQSAEAEIVIVTKALAQKKTDDPAAVAGALARRGSLYGRCGRFAEAAADFAKAIALDPTEHQNWYYQGCVLAYLGREEEYRDHCRAMLERFGDSDIPEMADRTAKTCLLLPGVNDPEPLLKASDFALDAPQDSRLRAWFSVAKSLALYRCGRFESCLQWTDEITPTQDQFPVRAATADLLRAMASHRLGRADQARQALERAVKRIEGDLPKAGQRDLGQHGIDNWLIALTLRREAQRLLSHPTTSANPS